MNRRSSLWTLTVLTCALGAGCGGGASGPAFRTLPGAPGEAVIYVYRPASFAGGGTSLFLWIDQRTHGRLLNGGYVAQRVAPGAHRVWLNPSSTALALDVAPGQSYFVRHGVMDGGSLQVVATAEALGEIRALRYSE